VESEETLVTAALRELAQNLWSEQSLLFAHDARSQPADLALNSWPGRVASYWAQEVDRRWRRNREDWNGLSEDESSAIRELLKGTSSTQNATRPAFAGLVFFLFAADPAFVEAHILPLFGRETSASQMWGTYLLHPRFNDEMLRAGLLDSMVFEWSHLEDIGGRGLQDQFCMLAAKVVNSSGLTPLERQRVLDGAVIAADGKHAPSFASAVVRLFEPPHADGAEAWDSWLREHLVARLDGLPRTAGPEELARWADVVPFLGGRIADAINLLNGIEIGLGEHYEAPSFPDGSLTAHGRELVRHLAKRIRNSIRTGLFQPYVVDRLISGVRAVVGDEVQPIVDAAHDRGFSLP
jgi:hypothetical protein